MADVNLTTKALAETKSLGKFIEAWDPKILGAQDPNPRTIIKDRLVQDLDIAIPARDDAILRGNIYRPEARKDEALPVILNYSVYGKDGAVDICVFPPGSGLDQSRITNHYLFEAADPGWWCHQGYVVASVDARGSFQSEGDKGYYSRDVGLDGYDIVEWLAKNVWCNGKVALYGASGYAMVQWLVAAENPPSLAAIIPIDGMTDMYREMAYKGGVLETQFNEVYPIFWNWGRNLVEDPNYGRREHPFYDDYWKSRIPALKNIQCPTYILCGWGDHGIHTRGTLNAWKQISSKHKYLEIHQFQKWEWSVTEESLGRQKAFLDTYLLENQNTEVQFWPKVRYTMREQYYRGEWRSANEFPLESTEYTKWYPTPSNGLSSVPQTQAHSVSYNAQTGEVAFELPITQSSLEFAGHAKLRLWVEAQGSDNMDLIITLRKLDRFGNPVYFPWLTIIDNGPIGFGFMRVSRRELDNERSTPYQPVHLHSRDLLLSPGEIVPVDIEIQPTSCRLRPGERLQVFISGHDYGTYPQGIPVARHPNAGNKGTHTIHFGGDYDSHLLLPVIPPVADSYSTRVKTVKMAMVATRIPGWTDDEFLKEYTGVHADMTRNIAAQVPPLRNYTQVVAAPRPNVKALNTAATSSTSWDCATILGWSTLKALWGSFQSPEYRATAGSHVFVNDTDTVGLLAVSEIDVIFDPIALEKRGDESVLVAFFLARNQKSVGDDKLKADMQTRADAVVESSGSTKLLRYVINKSITPEDTKTYFAGTPFPDFDWKTMVALEQYWFEDAASASAFFDEERRTALENLPDSFDLHKSICIVGRENRVVNKELSF